MKQTKLVRFEEGATLFKEGESSREMYIIRAGTARVMVSKNGRNLILTDLTKGHYVGEMSFLTGIPRSATVVAATPLLVSLITPDVLSEGAMGLSGWAVSIAKVLVRRIRKTTELLGDYIVSSNSEEPVPEKEAEPEKTLKFSWNGSYTDARLYLSGWFTEDSIDPLKSELRTLKMKEVKPLVMDFSDVIDIDHPGINYLFQLIQSYDVLNKDLRIENIQLIRDKVLAIKGIQDIVTTTQTPIRRVDQGDLLIEQGTVENVMYVVKAGAFSILRRYKGEEVELARAEAGDVIGEMSLVKEGVRSASVRADMGSMVYVIDTREFYKNVYNVPGWFMDLIKGLVQRLRDTNEMLDELVYKKKKKEQYKNWPSPFGIIVDSNNPGKLILQGVMNLSNLQYFRHILEVEIRRGTKNLTVDLARVKEADGESVSYFMFLYRKLKARGITMVVENPQKDIMKLFRNQKAARDGEAGL